MVDGNKRKRVLIVEYDVDLASLLETILADAGYQAEWLLRSPNTLADVRQHSPDLLVLDLQPREGECQVLDELRADSATAGIPVLVTAASEQTLSCALCSYNVRGFFSKPFDLDVFLGNVGDALGRPPLHAQVPSEVRPTGLAALAERIVARHSRAALLGWVQRLRHQSPWRERHDLPLHEVVNNVPGLVEAVAIALRYGSVDEFFRRHPGAVGRVRQHASARRQQGFSLADLIREYALLRDTLAEVLWRHFPPRVARHDALALTQTFNWALDRIIELTIPAYLEGADREAA